MSWEHVEEIDQNGVIVSYEVSSRIALDGSVASLMNTSSLNISFEVPVECMWYIIEVRAYTIMGPGPFSRPVGGKAQKI